MLLKLSTVPHVIYNAQPERLLLVPLLDLAAHALPDVALKDPHFVRVGGHHTVLDGNVAKVIPVVVEHNEGLFCWCP